MNSVQLHLALTHVPVILSLVGLVILAIAFFTKNSTHTKTAYYILLISGIAALPVYFSGEGAEEAVENLPGVTETLIESHEEIAKLAMFSIVIGGVLALIALFTVQWRMANVVKIVLFIFAIISGGLMVQTAHLGGHIRHSEISSNVQGQNEMGNEGGDHPGVKGSDQNKRED